MDEDKLKNEMDGKTVPKRINLDNNVSIEDLKAKMEALEREDDIEDVDFEDLNG